MRRFRETISDETFLLSHSFPSFHPNNFETLVWGARKSVMSHDLVYFWEMLVCRKCQLIHFLGPGGGIVDLFGFSLEEKGCRGLISPKPHGSNVVLQQEHWHSLIDGKEKVGVHQIERSNKFLDERPNDSISWAFIFLSNSDDGWSPLCRTTLSNFTL